tara:strand:+ start:541 stop:702 length:162 start_codon:yes stop_codon:yes gene_type:complete
MNSITRLKTIGIPALIGFGLVFIGNRIIKSEKELQNRERELRLQLDAKSINSY